jgi:hypothetical protein
MAKEIPIEKENRAMPEGTYEITLVVQATEKR